ncbi:MAG: helix-turn-helix domain-containing protein [Actinobacteria bacterium]|jgi:DNA-binding IclR family transcriptional regulator|nr:helix-turn-helix domain-containing protein [Actinomycetota bacterium]
MATETSQTLDRGLRVLEVVAESPDGLTVTELAAALDIGRTVVYRLVVTLENHAFLRRSADGKCRLGLGVLTLGRQVQPIVRDTALPALRLLADAVNATAVLTIVDGQEALSAVVVEPTRSDLHVAYRAGSRQPLEFGAAGRAILAARTAAGRPLDPPWVVATGDGPQGAYGIAVPVLGVPGLEASVGVLALRELNEADVGPRVARAAGEIARALR